MPSETSPVAIVAVNEEESEVYGILILNNDPKNIDLDQGCEDWENWINEEYDVSMDVSV